MKYIPWKPTKIKPTDIENQFRTLTKTYTDIILSKYDDSVITARNIQNPYVIQGSTIDGLQYRIGSYRTFQEAMKVYNYLLRKIQDGNEFISAADYTGNKNY